VKEGTIMPTTELIAQPDVIDGEVIAVSVQPDPLPHKGPLFVAAGLAVVALTVAGFMPDGQAKAALTWAAGGTVAVAMLVAIVTWWRLP
jgi:hypothetical protein